MPADFIKNLRFQGYNPRTLLDVGAHLGAFSRGFVEAFPHCKPTMIEPNPHCRDDLARLPFEHVAVAASREPGKAELHLTREWLQSTGASLYREQTPFFRDEVVFKQEVNKARLDDLFPDRQFDFVKIDVQGSELDVLIGGERLLRKADFVLIEVSLVQYNAGAPPAENIFIAMNRLGFRCADVTEFHRMNGVFDGALLQLDFLFERIVTRPTQNYRYTGMHDLAGLMEYLSGSRARCPDFSVIDVGASANPWSAPVIDATFDMQDCGSAKLHFSGDFNDRRAWDPLLAHVSRHGRFSYSICSHTLEDLAYPAVTMEMLPRIADAGFVSVPSRFLERTAVEGPYRGFIHHRWILDNVGETLMVVPKMPVLEYMEGAGEKGKPHNKEVDELQIFWRRGLSFSNMNNDYLGPTASAVVQMYQKFLDR
jgi:FkbM family methyltransferase